jgi:hypothetical protein
MSCRYEKLSCFSHQRLNVFSVCSPSQRYNVSQYKRVKVVDSRFSQRRIFFGSKLSELSKTICQMYDLI